MSTDDERTRDASAVSSKRARELADDADSSRAEVVATNRLTDELLAEVSHELRNPLNAILGWARLLGGGQLDPARMADAIRTIERNARALTASSTISWTCRGSSAAPSESTLSRSTSSR
jgi:signal transduction histidine kinase